MDIERDRKGECYILSHIRCGYHESMFVTREELKELFRKIKDLEI